MRKSNTLKKLIWMLILIAAIGVVIVKLILPHVSVLK